MTRFLPFVLAFLLLGCTTQTITPHQTGAADFARWTDAPPAYRFGPQDRIKVQFMLTPEVGEETIVGPDGFIGLRVAGRVRAQGLTAEQLQDAIAKASSKNLKDPIVTVSLLDAGSAEVVVGGQVARPGVYPLAGRDTPFEAVMLAGGFLPESRTDEVVLIRRNADNRPMLRTVDLQRYSNSGDLKESIPLQPGDLVFVPRTRVAEAGLWVDQVLNKMLPFSKGLSYNVNSGRD